MHCSSSIKDSKGHIPFFTTVSCWAVLTDKVLQTSPPPPSYSHTKRCLGQSIHHSMYHQSGYKAQGSVHSDTKNMYGTHSGMSHCSEWKGEGSKLSIILGYIYSNSLEHKNIIEYLLCISMSLLQMPRGLHYLPIIFIESFWFPSTLVIIWNFAVWLGQHNILEREYFPSSKWQLKHNEVDPGSETFSVTLDSIGLPH